MTSKQLTVEGTHSNYKTKLMHQIFEERLTEDWINRPATYYHDPSDGVRTTTFDEFNKKANRLGACILETLRATNANRNQDGDYVIAICMQTNDNVIALLMAIWKSGAAYLPLEPNFPSNRIEHIVREAQPALVIYDDDVDCNLFLNSHAITYNELVTRSSNCSEDNIQTESAVSCGVDDVAIVLYTSGSTGLPKGVRIPHSAIQNKLRWFELTFPFAPSERVSPLNSALINVDSVAEIFCPLLNGKCTWARKVFFSLCVLTITSLLGVAVLVILPQVTKDPSKLVDLLDAYKVERLVLVPSLLTSILAYLSLRNERHLLNNLKTWICCGETLTTFLAKKFYENFTDNTTHRLCNFYGSTEVMGDVTYYVCKNMVELEGLTKVPIGYPLDNTLISILDDNLNPTESGEIGEIFVAGMNLAKGYVAGREKTKFIYNRFTNDPKFDRFYRTGDFGKLINDRCIQYEGRADSQIKVRGNRVEILEIERVLRSLEDVDKCAVLCYQAGKEDQAVLAFVVRRDGDMVGGTCSNQQGREIENVLRTKLRDFEMPHVFVIKSIPLLPNGKVDRQTLLKVYESGNRKDDIAYDLTAIPNDKIETAKRVFEIVGNVIGRSIRGSISPESNFYELGGDSLNSVQTVTELREKGFFIGVTDFITAKCLGDVVDKICEKTLVDEHLTKFKTAPLAKHHKLNVIEIMTTSFHEKSDLGVHLPEHRSEHKEFIDCVWEYLLEKDISFVVTDQDDNVVGISLNKDGQDPPHVPMNNTYSIMLRFLDSIEKPILEKVLPQGKNKVFHSFVMGTSGELTAQENVEAIQTMEEINFHIAKRKGYIGIFSTNTSVLTQQFANIYGYQTCVDYQINEYVDCDGTKPFGKASDSERVMVHWKNI